MVEIKINCEVPPLKKGEIRVSYDDGDGLVVVDFEPGPINEVLRRTVDEYLKDAKIE